ncbi:MAG: hypothetical protein HRF48_11535, partial [Chloroflexota bacterium]
MNESGQLFAYRVLWNSGIAMSYRVVTRLRWIILAAALLVLLSACGINTSGEPKTIREQEIVSLPTQPPTNT